MFGIKKDVLFYVLNVMSFGSIVTTIFMELNTLLAIRITIPMMIIFLSNFSFIIKLYRKTMKTEDGSPS